ncbi:MAG: flap endonuclease-1 [Candidatus Micrarchaeota archaeon]
MGVDFSGVIASSPISLETLAGKKVAIDAYNAIYQFLSIIRQRDGTPLMDYNGKVTSHISGLFYRTARLLELGIRPVYVFDGPPPALKRRTLMERFAIKEEARKEWKQALEKGDIETARSKAQATSRLTREMVEESKQLLFMMGVPSIQAPGEGEAQAASLVLNGQAYASASQDYDSLLFGTPLLIKNFTMSGRRKLPKKDIYVEVEPELIDLDKNLAALKLTREKLVWMGILVGTDFNEGVKGIGPKKAYKLVGECSSLEEVISKSNSEFEVDPKELESLFLNPNVQDFEIPTLAPDPKALGEFLTSRAFSPERVKNTISAISKSYSDKGVQSRLDSFE